MDLTFDPFSGPMSNFITIGGWSFELDSVAIESPRSNILLSPDGITPYRHHWFTGVHRCEMVLSSVTANAYSMTTWLFLQIRLFLYR